MTNRVRQQIPISGIDTSTPTHSTPDGACEDIFNLRHRNGALHTVCKPEVLIPINNFNGYDIAHKMYCLPANEYIATRIPINTNNVEIAHVSIENGVVTLQSTITFGSGVFELFSFGAVLYATWNSGIKLTEDCFIYKDGKFSPFNLPEIEPPKLSVLPQYKYAGAEGMGQQYQDILTVTRSGTNEKKEFLYNESIGQLTDNGFVVGAFAIMAAYVLLDGNVIKPSAPVFVSQYPQEWRGSPKAMIRSKHNGIPSTEVKYADAICGVQPYITINPMSSSDQIKGVKIFATRAQKLFDYEQIHEKFVKDRAGANENESFTCRSRIFAPKATSLDEPFYEICTINRGEELEITLNAKDHFADAVYSNPYKASFSNHDTVAAHKFDYNNRLHGFCIKTALFGGFNDFPTAELPRSTDITDAGTAKMILFTSIDIDDKSLTTVTAASIVRLCRDDTKSYILIPNLLSYPDARAKNVEVIVVTLDETLVLYRKIFAFKNSYANNISYVFTDSKKLFNTINSYTFAPLIYSMDIPYEDAALPPAVIYSPNKMQVSAVNNPFFYAPENTYTVGENGSTIDAINTATEQISETRFGAFPLYVFTDKAIYAMEIGQNEVLYRSVINLSNERKLPHTTTVGAANLIFFIGDQGVMVIEGRQTYCISHALDTFIPTAAAIIPFEQYCASAKLSYNPKQSELMVFNSTYQYAYIYSLQSKMWTRRAWSGDAISKREIVIRAGVCSSVNEDESSPEGGVIIVTRPIILGSLEYKHIEAIVCRLNCGGRSSYCVTLDGSNDAALWQSLIKTESMPLLRHTMASYIYHRLRLEASVFDYFNITHFDAEYYLRFVRRLR